MSELIDNRARRVATLKEIIQHLHRGEAPEAVRNQLREMVRQTDASEIMAMEQELISGGMPVEEVRSMCDLHSQVTREVLVQLPAKPLTPGHPIDTFRRENAALRETVQKTRAAATDIAELDDAAECKAQLFQLRLGANELMDIDKHSSAKSTCSFRIWNGTGSPGLPRSCGPRTTKSGRCSRS